MLTSNVETSGVNRVAISPSITRFTPIVEFLEDHTRSVADCSNEVQFVRHVRNCGDSSLEVSFGVSGTKSKSAERGHTLLAAFPGGDDGGEFAGDVVQERIKGGADAVGVLVIGAGIVGEGAPLGGLVDGVRFEDEAALGADGVAGGVIEDYFSGFLAVVANSVRHCCLLASRMNE